jgi:hypothetical protein
MFWPQPVGLRQPPRIMRVQSGFKAARAVAHGRHDQNCGRNAGGVMRDLAGGWKNPRQERHQIRFETIGRLLLEPVGPVGRQAVIVFNFVCRPVAAPNPDEQNKAKTGWELLREVIVVAVLEASRPPARWRMHARSDGADGGVAAWGHRAALRGPSNAAKRRWPACQAPKLSPDIKNQNDARQKTEFHPRVGILNTDREWQDETCLSRNHRW